jgi:endonuclease/exonuclease/phosphatase family metal-dependent hydrolase
MSVVRKYLKIFFIILSSVACVAYVLACFSPYLNTSRWWLFGFISLGFPYLFLLLVFTVFFWLIVKPKISLLPLLCIAIGYKQLSVLFAWHATAKFSEQKAKNDLRIISWNVGSMYGMSDNNEIRKHDRSEIAEAVLKMDPDVVCLQEFNHSEKQGEQADNIGLFTEILPYYFFAKDVNKEDGFYEYGSIIFSKYPVLQTGKTKLYTKNGESIIYVDLLKEADTIRVYTTHLQSFKFNKEDYDDMEKIKEQDKGIAASKNIVQKMKAAFIRRGLQAETVKAVTDTCTHASIVCGDFNDVPNSFTYNYIRGNRQDAFLKKDFGIGRTYISLAPTLRIDYILPDDQFSVHQFDMVDEGLSDHVMLIADMSIKK